MKKWTIALALLLTMSMDANAQGFLKKLKDKAVEKVKDKIENKVERETDEVMDDVLDGKKKEKSSEKNRNDADDSSASASDEQPQATTSSDFKRGSVIMYQDNVTAEQVGEFPSKWDLFQGTVETKTLGGVKAINPTDNAQIQPLIKEQGAYLPEEFTIEYDFYYWNSKDDVALNDMKLILAVTKDRSEFPGEGHDVGDLTAFVLMHGVCDTREHGYIFNGNKDGAFEYSFKKGWNHVALSFNKRALKVYFNDKRVVNLPRVNQPTWMCFQVPFEYKNLTFIRNVVIAKGAVALYDRNAQDVSAVEKAIQETGKFVTNNILFDTGKATLKQESMIEIMKVADYMKKNPNVRFEVQGHTDNQGSDKINDPLSQQRAEAIVKALEGLGVDGFNLRAVGKGSHEPVADNKTEAGRAKNRRVEFIKK